MYFPNKCQQNLPETVLEPVPVWRFPGGGRLCPAGNGGAEETPGATAAGAGRARPETRPTADGCEILYQLI